VHWLFATKNIAFGASFTKLASIAIVGEKSGSIHPAMLCYTWYLQCSSVYCYRMCVHGLTLLAEWDNRSCTGQGDVWLQSVVPEYDQPCTCWFATTLISSGGVKCSAPSATQWFIEQGSEPQCRPFCHGVTIRFPVASCIKINYANCLWHLHYWNMEIHVSTNCSTVTSWIKYLQ